MRTYVCELCPHNAQRACKTPGSLAVHKARSHGVERPEKSYLRKCNSYDEDNAFKSFCCEMCGKTFDDAQKAINHIVDGLPFSTKCAKALSLAGKVKRFTTT